MAPIERTPHQAVGARIRAARAYAAMSQPQLGAVLGVSAATVKRMEVGSRATTPEELLMIAQTCRVPRAFFADGFVDGDLNLTPSMRAELQAVVTAAVDDYLRAHNGELRRPPRR